MQKSLPTRTGQKILRKTFFLNTLKAATLVLNSIHASALWKSKSEAYLVNWLLLHFSQDYNPVFNKTHVV